MACASPKTLALPIIHILHILYIAYMVYILYMVYIVYMVHSVYIVHSICRTYKVSTILSVLSGTKGTGTPGASRRGCWSFMATIDTEDCGDLVDHA